MMDIDDVIVRTGEFGRFQRKAMIGICMVTVFCGTQMVQNIFAGSIPVNKTCTSNPKIVDACDKNCTSIMYPDDNFQSFATEWNMVCGLKATQAISTQSIFMAGLMVGSFFMGGLGDRFGRFPVLFGCELMCSVFAFASSFCRNWTLYVILRFLTGFCESGIIIVSFVLTSELVGPSKRNLVGTLPAFTFASGICVLSITAWYTSEWRLMSAVLGILGLATVPPLYCLYDESPRWYLGKGEVVKCKRVLKKIAETNDASLDEFSLKVPEKADNNKSRSGSSMLDLFRNKILLKLTLIQLYTWFACSAVYYGLTIASGKMGGNKYVSVIFNAFVEIPSNLIVVFLMNHPRLGRVRSCILGFVVSSVCCASVWFVRDEYKTTTVILACAGKFFICFSFAVIYVQAAELYPTPVRNVALGLVSVSNRVGGVLAPQFLGLDNIAHKSHFILFGVLGLLGCFLSSLLPETLGKPLPDTPDDIYMGTKKADKNVVSLTASPDRHRLLVNSSDGEDNGADNPTFHT